jgi:hypothetical protein
MSTTDLASRQTKPLCLVIGPVGDEQTEIRNRADSLLRYIIRKALARRYRVKRADEDTRPGLITSQLIRDIEMASLIVADLSGLNANAFYELGVAHALNRKVIHVCDKETELPFDMKDYRTIFFDVFSPDSHQKTVDKIRDHEKALISDESWQTPVTHVLNGKNTPKLNRVQSHALAAAAMMRVDPTAWDCLADKNNWAGSAIVSAWDSDVLVLQVKYPITDDEKTKIYKRLLPLLPPSTQFAIEVVGDDGTRLFKEEGPPKPAPGWRLRKA